LPAQVRIVLNRNADLRMIGGRNEMDAEFDVGFDDEGRCAIIKRRALKSWPVMGMHAGTLHAEA